MNFGRQLESKKSRGIALLDALLAVFVFALAVTGLVTWMSQIGDNSNLLGKERLVQQGLSGILAEAKVRDLADMNFEFNDQLLGVVYRTSVEPAQLTTTEGKTLENMYVLRATADYAEGALGLTRAAEIYVYKPEDRDR